MKTVTVTLKVQFETEETDNDTLKEGIASQIEELIENDELLDSAKIKIVDHDGDDDDADLDFEDDGDDA